MRWKERIAVAFGWVVVLAACVLIVLLAARECQAEPRGLFTCPWVRESRYEEAGIAFMVRRGAEPRLFLEECWFRELAAFAEDVTWGTTWPDTPLLLAVSFRESSWKPLAVGRAMEIGLMQLKGTRAREGYSAEAVARSPSLNLWLGRRHLERSRDECGKRDQTAILCQYGTGACDCGRRRGTAPAKVRRSLWSARRVLQWARWIRERRGP